MYTSKGYGEQYRGVYLVRGENVVLLGEVEENKESNSHLESLVNDAQGFISMLSKSQTDIKNNLKSKSRKMEKAGLSGVLETGGGVGMDEELY